MQNNDVKYTEQLLKRIEYLEENRRFVANSLESVLSLGDFQENIYSIKNPDNILQETGNRISRLISFETRAMYIVNKDSSDFILSACNPDTASEMIEKEVLFMIENGFFARALREKRGVTIASMDKSRQFVLHVIENRSRIRGMFIGLLPERKHSIPDTSRILLSIILLNTANALESLELYDLLNNQNHILEQKVKARTMELIRSERRMQQLEKMEALGTLAGGVAHDLNNVLSGIVSYPDLILFDLAEDDPLRKPLMTIKESGDKAASIVQDLLTMTRRGVAVKEALNLNIIVNNYMTSPEHMKLKTCHPDIIVKKDLNTNLLNMLGSQIHLFKTIMNLVSNAAESQQDGGTITIFTENRYIDHLINGYDKVEEGDYVILTVTDTGSGISAKDLKNIFEPFYTKKKMGRSGTGLGMTVVWGTVKDHNGYIDVCSTEGEGTVITLYFPVTREKIPDVEIKKIMAEYMGHGQTVLVVDDVKEQREIACSMLESLDYVVGAVADGEAAVQYVKDKPVDLLVLDMIMDPGIDGLETYERILNVRPGQKAVIASGFSETDRVKKAQELGAGAYVKKPYTLENIGMAIRSQLIE